MLIVITGGPGSGKSTLIEALAREGYATVASEAGRAIIRDQAAIGGTALPWTDPRLFAELMLSWEMRSHREASALGKAAVFFDRGVPDVPKVSVAERVRFIIDRIPHLKA